MPYIEKIKKKKNNFYYLTQTVRLGNKFKKIRSFLGKGKISQKRLKELAKAAKKHLEKETEKIKKQKEVNADKKMKIEIKKENFTKIVADAVVLPLFGKQVGNQLTNQLPSKLKKEISELFDNKSLKGEFGELRLLNSLGLIKPKNILLVNLGKEKDLKPEMLRRASANTFRAAKSLNFKIVVTTLANLGKAEESAQAIAEGSLLADYSFDRFKTKKEEKKINSLLLSTEKNVSQAVEKGTIIAEATNYTRELVNLPAAIVTPEYLGREALKLKNVKTSVKVYTKEDIKRMGMGGLLAVSSGSAQDPRFIVIKYKGGGKKKTALVGKGITFDAGGLNIKTPARYMEDMKQDMAGAAAVLGTIKAAQKLKLKNNLIGIIPSCENLLGSKAYKPGDILTAHNKKTIEISNTDAEGRLILADALSFAEKEKPNFIVDVATLTGAVEVALGKWATGLLSKDKNLAKALIKAGEASGDRVWQLPMWDDYRELVKSDFADVSNSYKGYAAGTIEGGMFLSNFVEKISWAHLDIGGTAWFNEQKFYFTKGGTGAGVRLLVYFLENN